MCEQNQWLLIYQHTREHAEPKLHIISKIPTSNRPPPTRGIVQVQATIGKYYIVVDSPSETENKNPEEIPKIDKVGTFLENTNDNIDNLIKNSDNNRTEEATSKEIHTQQPKLPSKTKK